MKSLFHLAYNVNNLEETRSFYKYLLECKEGRSTDTWVDFDFFGHQISLHLGEPFKVENTGKVGENMVAMPHLGVILEMDDWKALAKRLEDANVEFKAENETLKAEVVELSKQPAAKAVKTEVKQKTYVEMTNYEKLKFNRGE